MFRPAYLLILFALFSTAVLYGKQDSFSSRHTTFGNAHYSVNSDAFKNVSVSAASYIVFDATTGEVFGAKAPTVRHEMASVTKLITADTALSTSTIDSSTTISWRAIATDGKAGNLEAGEKYHVRELVFPLLLESSNDAAEAIASTALLSNCIV